MIFAYDMMIVRKYNEFSGIGGAYECKYLFPNTGQLNREDILFLDVSYEGQYFPKGIQLNNGHLVFAEAGYLDSIARISTNIGRGMEFHPQLIVIAPSMELADMLYQRVEGILLAEAGKVAEIRRVNAQSNLGSEASTTQKLLEYFLRHEVDGKRLYADRTGPW